MRTAQLDPFWRTSIGFDRLMDLMDQSQLQQDDNYPPYNITRTGEDAFRITLAVAGFTPDNITITAHQNTLIVAGQAGEKQDGADYLYRGIAGRPFERRFNLADFVEVLGASFENGLLQIDLERRVPDAMKPRRVQINSKGASKVTSIDQARVG